jgi:hypothetical protein
MGTKRFCVMISVFCAIGVVVFLVAFGVTSSLVTVADAFFVDLSEGDFASAYRHLSVEFHGNTSVDELRTFAQESALARYSEATWWERVVSGDVGSLDGEVTTLDGEYVPVTMYFLKENGVWKIYQIDWESDTPVADDAIPEESGL